MAIKVNESAEFRVRRGGHVAIKMHINIGSRALSPSFCRQEGTCLLVIGAKAVTAEKRSVLNVFASAWTWPSDTSSEEAATRDGG